MAVRLAADRVVIGDPTDGLGMGGRATAALRLVEPYADDQTCVHVGVEWRQRVEAWAQVFGVSIRAAEQGQDIVQPALDGEGPVRTLACAMCGYAGIEAAARFARSLRS